MKVIGKRGELIIGNGDDRTYIIEASQVEMEALYELLGRKLEHPFDTAVVLEFRHVKSQMMGVADALGMKLVPKDAPLDDGS